MLVPCSKARGSSHFLTSIKHERRVGLGLGLQVHRYENVGGERKARACHAPWRTGRNASGVYGTLILVFHHAWSTREAHVFVHRATMARKVDVRILSVSTVCRVCVSFTLFSYFERLRFRGVTFYRKKNIVQLFPFALRLSPVLSALQRTKRAMSW